MTTRHAGVFGAIAVALLCIGLAVAAGSATGAYPGKNGFLVFSTDLNTGPLYGTPDNYNIYRLDPSKYRWGYENTRPDLASGGLLKLTDTESPAGNRDQTWPSVSGDGRRIAYSEEVGRDTEIWVMNADGSDKVRLTYNRRQDIQATFSPDGKLIAYASTRGGETEIWVVRLDGGGERRLTADSAIDQTTGKQANPTWSPDGSQVFFQGTTYKEVPWGQDALYRVDAAAVAPQHPKLVVNLFGIYRMRGFAFDATGTRIIWAVSTSKATKIRDQLITGMNLPDLRAFDPRFGPYFIYQQSGDGACGVCRPAWAGDKLRRFPGNLIFGFDERKYPNSPGYGFPAFSPEGDVIAYQTLDRGAGAYSADKPPLIYVVGKGLLNWEDVPVRGHHWGVKQPDWGPAPAV